MNAELYKECGIALAKNQRCSTEEGRKLWTEYSLSPHHCLGEDLLPPLAIPPGQEMHLRIGSPGGCWLHIVLLLVHVVMLQSRNVCDRSTTNDLLTVWRLCYAGCCQTCWSRWGRFSCRTSVYHVTCPLLSRCNQILTTQSLNILTGRSCGVVALHCRSPSQSVNYLEKLLDRDKRLIYKALYKFICLL